MLRLPLRGGVRHANFSCAKQQLGFRRLQDLEVISMKVEVRHKILVLCNRIDKIVANRIVDLEKVPRKASGREQGGLLISECLLPPGDGIPTVFVAVAGRSNGLGPVMSGNTAYPVVNCPPLSADWGTQDVWSSLRLPSGKMIFNLHSCTDLALFSCCCSSVHTYTKTHGKTLEKQLDQYWRKS